MKNKQIIRNAIDAITYGKSNKKNDSNGILDTVYITILCGAPIGRTIHPTLAAMVCKDTVNIVKSILSTFFKAKIEKGTKIISETSLVMKMELKKHVKTKTKTSPRTSPILVNSLRTKISKTARFFKISTIIMITKSNMIVSQLI